MFVFPLSLTLMDSLTHIVLGACIGKVVLPQKMGKKALILGAIAHSIPDIDAISSFFNTATQDLVIHRAISHSLFIAIIFALLFAAFSYTRYKRTIKFARFFFPFLLLVGLHDILDTCNNYGTELFAPFSDKRYSFHLLYVADPLFSIVPLIAAIFLFIKKNNWRYGKIAAILGIVVPCTYVSLIGIGKTKVEKALAKNPPIPNAHFDFLTPTPFNGFLWYGVFSNDSTVYTTYRSTFDQPNYSASYSSYAINKDLLKPYMEEQDTKNLLEFSEGIYTIEQKQDTIQFNIPRFGQIMGWQYANAPFTFYYYVHPDVNNSLAVQRGRLKGWNKQSMAFFWNRITGKHPTTTDHK
ncbi:MAG: metal-dependent hydrolase [Pseudopedobacter saltans]|uniref:Metal-dependent hydrolase n=1 Tax=Pseudopedobacter saltans TaxID=151895 RepID=A0A2W5F5C8_9SPHI|nr:MAG: metal-dependent hydrolase [Pseudopedobacter saltans]